MNNDKDIGKQGELLWITKLEESHVDIVTAPNYKFYDWDVKGKYNNKEYTYEVKYDVSGYYYANKYDRPVNLYVEFRNTVHNEDSGIKASKADYYVYIFRETNNVNRAYVFRRKELLNYLIANKDLPIVENSKKGDSNAIGWLVSLDNARNFCDAILEV